eukprot:scaffold11034_cov155-Skeletonema_dohrnii-CCMP3373.AAC.1
MEELVLYLSLKIASASRLDSFRVSRRRRLLDQDDIFFSRLVSSRSKEYISKEASLWRKFVGRAKSSAVMKRRLLIYIVVSESPLWRTFKELECSCSYFFKA